MLVIPGGLCWPIHRIATSGRYTDGLTTIEERWTLQMVADACDVLDAFDDMKE